MTVQEFNDYYDGKVKETETRLPNPYTYPNLIIQIPILFSDLIYPFVLGNRPATDKISFHKVYFRKTFYSDNSIKWEQIV